MLRPEKITLLASDAAVPAALLARPGRVVNAGYLGMFTRYQVALEDGTMLAVVEQNAQTAAGQTRLAAGQAVQAAWREDNVRPLKQEEP